VYKKFFYLWASFKVRYARYIFYSLLHLADRATLSSWVAKETSRWDVLPP